MNIEIKHALQNIITAAYEVSATGIAQVFVDYSGHVDVLRVYAYPAGCVWSDADVIGHERIFTHDIPLYQRADDPAPKLDAALNDILALLMANQEMASDIRHLSAAIGGMS